MLSKRLVVLGCSLLVLAVGCGIAIRRDLSAIPPGQVGFDDMCGLQGYFDAIEIKTSPAPRVVSALDMEGASSGRTLRGGKERFAFENDFQLTHLKRVLNENWRRLPDQIAKATEIEIEVKWAEKAGLKRVTTEEESEIAVGTESWSLPYHPCISELLYGEPLYRQRREIWGLPLPAVTPAVSAPSADAGAPGSSSPARSSIDAGSH
jgi:lambda repressor-like predicted transcriptional regulator